LACSFLSGTTGFFLVSELSQVSLILGFLTDSLLLSCSSLPLYPLSLDLRLVCLLRDLSLIDQPFLLCLLMAQLLESLGLLGRFKSILLLLPGGFLRFNPSGLGGSASLILQMLLPEAKFLGSRRFRLFDGLQLFQTLFLFKSGLLNELGFDSSLFNPCKLLSFELFGSLESLLDSLLLFSSLLLSKSLVFFCEFLLGESLIGVNLSLPTIVLLLRYQVRIPLLSNQFLVLLELFSCAGGGLRIGREDGMILVIVTEIASAVNMWISCVFLLILVTIFV